MICPVLPDDSVLLTLPFGGAVLQTIGISKPEVDSILDEFKEQYMKYYADESRSFLETLNTPLPPLSFPSASATSSPDDITQQVSEFVTNTSLRESTEGVDLSDMMLSSEDSKALEKRGLDFSLLDANEVKPDVVIINNDDHLSSTKDK